MNPSNPDPNTRSRVSNDLRVMQPGERELFTIKRHPVGIIGTYVAIAIVLIVTAIFVIGVLPSVIGDDNKQVSAVGMIVFVILGGLSLIYALIATKVYWGNSWVVTSDSITQVDQTGLFIRKSSQLSLENIEDISAEQNGILAHALNYGVIKAETAGEHSNFSFAFCPNPNYYAQQILHARELFEQGDHGQPEHQQPPAIETNHEPVTNPLPPTDGFKSNS